MDIKTCAWKCLTEKLNIWKHLIESKSCYCFQNNFQRFEIKLPPYIPKWNPNIFAGWLIGGFLKPSKLDFFIFLSAFHLRHFNQSSKLSLSEPCIRTFIEKGYFSDIGLFSVLTLRGAIRYEEWPPQFSTGSQRQGGERSKIFHLTFL